MTIQEASERDQIPMHILCNDESWGLCGAVKKVMGDWRYVAFLGCPIWWGQAPKVIYTFLESCDFGGATIVPFCTSGSSGTGSSACAGFC